MRQTVTGGTAAARGPVDTTRRWESGEEDRVDNDVLRQAPLFSALDDEAASALRASMSQTKVRRGEVLFREGDSGDRLFVVTDGKVKLGRSSSDGRENLLAILGPGQMFGELSLFDPGPRSATVTAVTDMALLVLCHDEMVRWLTAARRSPAGCCPARRQAAQSQRRGGRPGVLRRPRPGGEGAARPAARFGRTADDGVHVHHDLTQEELAQLVGASRETVNKALADFAPAAGCGWSPARWSCSTSSGSPAAPASPRPARSSTRRSRR